MNLKVKLLYGNSKAPERALTGDAGLDLFSVENVKIQPGEWKLIKTGIALQLPQKTEGQIRPKSGLALRHGITVLNSPGTIDEGFRGEIGVILINHGKEEFIVEERMKIAQLVVKPVETCEVLVVDVLEKSDRGINGFGSTGK